MPRRTARVASGRGRSSAELTPPIRGSTGDRETAEPTDEAAAGADDEGDVFNDAKDGAAGGAASPPVGPPAAAAAAAAAEEGGAAGVIDDSNVEAVVREAEAALRKAKEALRASRKDRPEAPAAISGRESMPMVARDAERYRRQMKAAASSAKPPADAAPVEAPRASEAKAGKRPDPPSGVGGEASGPAEASATAAPSPSTASDKSARHLGPPRGGGKRADGLLSMSPGAIKMRAWRARKKAERPAESPAQRRAAKAAAKAAALAVARATAAAAAAKAEAEAAAAARGSADEERTGAADPAKTSEASAATTRKKRGTSAAAAKTRKRRKTTAATTRTSIAARESTTTGRKGAATEPPTGPGRRGAAPSADDDGPSGAGSRGDDDGGGRESGGDEESDQASGGDEESDQASGGDEESDQASGRNSDTSSTSESWKARRRDVAKAVLDDIKLEEYWETWFEDLSRYKALVGDCMVPEQNSGSLGNFVRSARKEHTKWSKGLKTRLTEERRVALEQLGFVWRRDRDSPPVYKRRRKTWSEHMKDLIRFKHEYGHCYVPFRSGSLGRFCVSQRAEYRHWRKGKNTRLTEQRRAALDELCFDWERAHQTHNSTEDNDQNDESFSGEGGRPELPGIDSAQSDDASWRARLEDLRQYKALVGHCMVPEGKGRLFVFVETQRVAYRKWKKGMKTDLTEERRQALEQLGFVWEEENTEEDESPLPLPAAPYKRGEKDWNDCLEQLRSFKEENGHCNVAWRSGKLGQFCAKQRGQYRLWKRGKNSSMTPHRIAALESLGFEWGPLEPNKNMMSFNGRLEELRRYKEENGHCNVNEREGPLGRFVHRQRVEYSKWKRGMKSYMTDAKREALDGIGFVWRPTGLCFDPDPEDQSGKPKKYKLTFEERVEQLRQVKEINGHCNIGEKHGSLGNFVHKQRVEYSKWMKGKKTSLTDERRAALNELGFVWRPKGFSFLPGPAEDGASPKKYLMSFDERIEQLRRFKEENGHLNVSEQAGSLGNFVHKQRVEYVKWMKGRKTSLTDERRAKLNELGFVWRPRGRPFGLPPAEGAVAVPTLPPLPGQEGVPPDPPTTP